VRLAKQETMPRRRLVHGGPVAEVGVNWTGLEEVVHRGPVAEVGVNWTGLEEVVHRGPVVELLISHGVRK
jgi:hypothetical protein